MNFYYGLVDKENNAWGFLEETDDRAWEDKDHTQLKETMVFLTNDEWRQVLREQSQGRQIVGYGGKCFTAEQGRYYVDEKGWHKKTDATFNKEKATAKAEELVNQLYQIKADRAYGGVIINDTLVFETNQTSITNTVASLALMQDGQSANWKFYTTDGKPVVQKITKTQLSMIAMFGQNMINACFEVEGNFNKQLQSATTEDLINTTWTENFVAEAKKAMEAIDNKVTIEFEV